MNKPNDNKPSDEAKRLHALGLDSSVIRGERKVVEVPTLEERAAAKEQKVIEDRRETTMVLADAQGRPVSLGNHFNDPTPGVQLKEVKIGEMKIKPTGEYEPIEDDFGYTTLVSPEGKEIHGFCTPDFDLVYAVSEMLNDKGPGAICHSLDRIHDGMRYFARMVKMDEAALKEEASNCLELSRSYHGMSISNTTHIMPPESLRDCEEAATKASVAQRVLSMKRSYLKNRI